MGLIAKPYDWDVCMLEMAGTLAKMSKDPSTQVGALLVSPDKRKMSGGYNGFPVAIDDREEWWNRRESDDPEEFVKYDLVVHAEENAICQARTDLTDWTLYCTHQSCLRCSRLIAAQGVKKVVWDAAHGVTRMDLQTNKALKLFQAAGIKVVQLKLSLGKKEPVT